MAKVKKEEALNKYKESGRRVVEGGKEFGIGVRNVLWGTCKSLFYTLKYTTEAGISAVSNNKSKNLDLSEEFRNKNKNRSIKYSNKSKESIHNVGGSLKQVGNGTWGVVKGGFKSVVNVPENLVDSLRYLDVVGGEAIEKKQKEKGKNKVSWMGKFGRNHVASLSAALLAGGVAGGVALNNMDIKDININKPNRRKINIRNDAKALLNPKDTLLIPTQEYNHLTIKPISPDARLTHRYLGGDGEKTGNIDARDTLVLNPAESLHNLWKGKIQKYGTYTKDINKLDSMDVKNMSPEDIEDFRIKHPVDATYLFVARPYIDGEENREIMSLQEFIEQTNNIVVEIRELSNGYDGELKGNKKELFDTMRNDITGECIVAYAMTELCENKQIGEFNKELFDLVLRNHGVNFLAKIPAMYDKKTSYGLYQFTEYALYDTPGATRGASIVNKFLPDDKKLPGSVIDLDTRQEQTQAAYQFAIVNLSDAVAALTDQEAKDLLSYHKSNKEKFRNNMTQLIAMCHHRPIEANALKKWHNAGHKNDIYTYGGAKHGAPYGRASKINYESLKK